jgi:hypothetical protein
MSFPDLPAASPAMAQGRLINAKLRAAISEILVFEIIMGLVVGVLWNVLTP